MCSHSDAAFAWRHAEPSKNMNDAFNFESFSVIFSPSFSLSSFLPFFLSLPSSSSFFNFFFFFFFFFSLLFLLFLVVFLTRFVYSRQWRRASRREPKIKKASRLARKAAPPRLQTNKKSRLEISIFVFIILIYLIFFNNFFSMTCLFCFGGEEIESINNDSEALHATIPSPHTEQLLKCWLWFIKRQVMQIIFGYFVGFCFVSGSLLGRLLFWLCVMLVWSCWMMFLLSKESISWDRLTCCFTANVNIAVALWKFKILCKNSSKDFKKKIRDCNLVY